MSKENDDLIQESLRSTDPDAKATSEAAKTVDALLAEPIHTIPDATPPPTIRVPPPVRPTATRIPQVDTTSPEAQKAATEATGKPMTNAELADMLKNLPPEQMEEFTRRVAAETRRQSAAEATTTSKSKIPEYVTDFSTLQEKDIFDLRVPIEAISHEIPEFLTVKLLDPNYVPRWIQTNSRRLGQAHAEGWLYVTEEDLAEELKVEVADDVSGHYLYADVVLMKLSKAKLYSRIRANFLKSLAVTKTQAAFHDAMKKVIQQDLTNSAYGEDWATANREGKMSTYSPLVGA